jgi:hypothetical protein
MQARKASDEQAVESFPSDRQPAKPSRKVQPSRGNQHLIELAGEA